MTEIICTFITAAAGIIVAILSIQLKKSESLAAKRAAEVDERAELRKKESLLSMQMNFANLSLAMTTSLALSGGHTNGNVEAAQKEAEEAAKAYQDFIHEQGFKQIIE